MVLYLKYIYIMPVNMVYSLHGCVTTRGEPILAANATALNDDIWPVLSTKSESPDCSTLCNSQPWLLVRSSKSPTKCCTHLILQLSNKFPVLDSEAGPCTPMVLQLDGGLCSSAQASWQLVEKQNSASNDQASINNIKTQINNQRPSKRSLCTSQTTCWALESRLLFPNE